jgi:hypothetical protein
VSLLAPSSASRRTAILRIGVPVVVVAIVGGVLLARCGGGSSAKKPAVQHPGPSTTVAEEATFRLRLGKVEVQDTGPPAPVGKSLRRVLLAATQKYLDDAVLAPLRTGRVNAGYLSLFDAGVNGSAAKADRGVLTEVNIGRTSGPVAVTGSPVRIDGLGDPAGKIAMAATTFDLHIVGRSARGPIDLYRSAELTFVDEFGHWLVTAYRVSVHRTIGSATTATTAHAGRTTTTKGGR